MDEPRSLRGPIQSKAEKVDLSRGTDDSRAAMIKPFCNNVGSSLVEYFHDKHGYFLAPFPQQVSNKSYPIIGNTRLAGGCHADITAPISFHSSPKWPGSDDPNNKDATPWSDKQDILYWRGSATGGHQVESNLEVGGWRRMHRHRFVNYTSRHGHGYDVGFTGMMPQTSAEYKQLQSNEYRMVGKSTYGEHFRHKYLLDVDGNSFSQRFINLLALGKSLLVRAGMFESWERGTALPFAHYIPISLNPEVNMDSILDTLRKQDSIAEEIALAGHQLAASRLRHEDQVCYWYRLILEYATLRGPLA